MSNEFNIKVLIMRIKLIITLKTTLMNEHFIAPLAVIASSKELQKRNVEQSVKYQNTN